MDRLMRGTGLGSGAVLALGALLGCGPSDAADQPPAPGTPVSPTDSAGVLISVTDGAKASSSLGWIIDSVPDLVLGTSSHPDQQFFGVRGLRALPDGGVLVVDAITRELRFFDSTGHLTHRSGRKGEGPGEYDDPYLVHTIGATTLLLWDGRLKRFQVLSEQGEDPRVIRLSERWRGGRHPPLGAVGTQMFARFPEMAYRVRWEKKGVKTRRVDFSWVQPAAGTEVRVATFGE